MFESAEIETTRYSGYLSQGDTPLIDNLKSQQLGQKRSLPQANGSNHVLIVIKRLKLENGKHP
ncbi:hypothetical protein ES708_08228 [subsurface metagenome]